ncbi:MAG: FG-GAP repeat protein [Dokdonella sp.]|uniref:FG-GAP repeat protein n=1 Tax=Dokdonella sp. TaxID=2291710 RepID=UPI003262FF3E
MPPCAPNRPRRLARVVADTQRGRLDGLRRLAGLAVLLLGLVGASTAASTIATGGNGWSPGQPGDEFAFALAVDGNRLIGSSPGASQSTGATYAFDCTNAPCTQTFLFTPTDLAAGDRFGASLALSGGTLAVGAPGQSPAAVYVFVQSGSTWVQQAKLTAFGTASSTGFGRTLAMAGDHLAIAAPGADERAGAVYVFDRSGSSWNEATRFGAGDPAAGDGFGRSMAIAGDTLVVGAPLKSSGVGQFANGAAYVFVRSATAWLQQAKLTLQSSGNGDSFGTAVAIDGDRALVGAPLGGVPVTSVRSGSAYVFERTGAAWTQHEQLTGSGGAEGDRFGWSVALSGNGALVGAPFAFNSCGATYSFVRTASGWSRTDESIIGAITLGDLVGWTVAADPTHWVVAAPGSAGPLDHSGQAHLMPAGDLVFGDGFELPAMNTCAPARPGRY